MKRAKKLPLSEKHLGILLHSLGVQLRAVKWSKGGWRNHYCANPGDDDFVDCRLLECGGWMVRLAFFVHPDASESMAFKVTEAGIVALRLAGWEIEVDP